jgi:hypothetical protein
MAVIFMTRRGRTHVDLCYVALLYAVRFFASGGYSGVINCDGFLLICWAEQMGFCHQGNCGLRLVAVGGESCCSVYWVQ